MLYFILISIGKNSEAWSDGWFNLYEKSKGVQFQSNEGVVVDFLKVNS